MSREIRRVPKRWEHPKQVNEYSGKTEHRPMYDHDFKEDYVQWKKNLNRWYANNETYATTGEYIDWDGKKEKAELAKYPTWQSYSGDPESPPNPNDYMPKGAWYQLFETVSEGTPLSPPFETKQELKEWLTNHKDYWDHQWTREQTEAMLKAEWAPSGVMSNGKFYTAEESLTLKG